jgi:hypothetical protein
VFESDVGSWSFRRYQQLVDVEVWVPENRAGAHTASYVRAEAVKRGRLEDKDVVNAFVTEYGKPDGVLRAVVTFVRRLAQESGYVVDETKLGGVRVFTVTGHGESWALWGSGKFVVKIGGRGLDKVPPGVVAAYGEPYPSGIAEGMLDGELPPGLDEGPKPTQEPYDPDSPTPDWEHEGKRKK